MSAQGDSLPKMSSYSLRLDAVGYGRPEAVFFGRRADVRFSTEVLRDVQLALLRRVCNNLSRQPDRIWSAASHFILVIFPDWS